MVFPLLDIPGTRISNPLPQWIIDQREAIQDDPSLNDKLNGISFFIDNPCDAPWTVYLETLVAPAGKAALTLVTFGLDDVLRGFFRPSGIRSRRHGRRGRRGGRRLPGIPEFGESIAKKVPGQKAFSQRLVSQETKFLWRVDGVLQRALWFWLVADVTVDFFYNWTSLINSSEFCVKQNTPSVLAEGVGNGVGAIQGWLGKTIENVTYARAGLGWLGASSNLPSGRFGAVGTSTVVNTGAFDQTYQIGWFRGGDPEQPLAVSAPVSIGPFGSATAIVSAAVTGNQAITLMQKVSVGFIAPVDASAFITASEPVSP